MTAAHNVYTSKSQAQFIMSVVNPPGGAHVHLKCDIRAVGTREELEVKEALAQGKRSERPPADLLERRRNAAK